MEKQKKKRVCFIDIPCISLWGLKSESYIKIVSAEVKLIPSPPAFVDSKKQNSFESGANWLINFSQKERKKKEEKLINRN